MLRVAFRYDDDRLFARLVCLARGGNSAHCEVAIYSGEGNVHKCISSSFVDDGVRAKDIDLDPSKWEIYQTDVPVSKAYDWLAANRGRRYGWIRLVRFIIPFIRFNVGGPICTMAVGMIIGLQDEVCHDVRSLKSAVQLRWSRVIG